MDTVSKLRLQSSGSLERTMSPQRGGDHGQMKRNIDPVHLLTEALSKVEDVAATGGIACLR